VLSDENYLNNLLPNEGDQAPERPDIPKGKDAPLSHPYKKMSPPFPRDYPESDVSPLPIGVSEKPKAPPPLEDEAAPPPDSPAEDAMDAMDDAAENEKSKAARSDKDKDKEKKVEANPPKLPKDSSDSDGDGDSDSDSGKDDDRGSPVKGGGDSGEEGRRGVQEDAREKGGGSDEGGGDGGGSGDGGAQDDPGNANKEPTIDGSISPDKKGTTSAGSKSGSSLGNGGGEGGEVEGSVGVGVGVGGGGGGGSSPTSGSSASDEKTPSSPSVPFNIQNKERKEEEDEKEADDDALRSANRILGGGLEAPANAPLSPHSDDMYYEPEPEAVSVDHDKDECRVHVNECSKSTAIMTDDIAVACMGIHLNGIVALPQEKRCKLVTEYGAIVGVK
jgi:hypothetical protein